MKNPTFALKVLELRFERFLTKYPKKLKGYIPAQYIKNGKIIELT